MRAIPLAAALASPSVVPLAANPTRRPPRMAAPHDTAAANDNRSPAGTYVGDTLVLRLTVATVSW